MKTAEFRSGSWHQRLAAFGGLWRSHTDICAYTRAVLWGLCKLVFFTLCGALAAFWVGEWLGWLLAGLMEGFVDPGFAAMIVNIALIVCAAFATVVCVGVVTIEYALPIIGDAIEDSFVANAWDSFKNRVCFRVEIK
jgi:hypothetical protein